MTRVICVDEDGNIESSKWLKNKKPERYPSNGPSYVRGYVEKLAASESEFASLIVFSPDYHRGFLLMKRHDEPITFGTTNEWRDEPEKEVKARDFFKDLGIEPESDYLAGNGGVPDATRVLDWPIGTSADIAADICERAMRELCEIEDEEALDITFEEKKSRENA